MRSVGFICTGNICRSPMGEVVLTQFVADDPALRNRVTITSAGTANWHVGSPMDDRARSALRRAGFNQPGSLAQFASREYLQSLDLTVVMTREHRHDVRERGGDDGGPIILIRSLLESQHELDLADPYYGDDRDFDACLDTIIRSCRVLVRERLLGGGPSSV